MASGDVLWEKSGARVESKEWVGVPWTRDSSVTGTQTVVLGGGGQVVPSPAGVAVFGGGDVSVVTARYISDWSDRTEPNWLDQSAPPFDYNKTYTITVTEE